MSVCAVTGTDEDYEGCPYLDLGKTITPQSLKVDDRQRTFRECNLDKELR